MDAFTVYSEYISLKLHFKEQSYDYFKYGIKKTSPKRFHERKDKFNFIRLSKILRTNEVSDFFVANFIQDSSIWIGNLVKPQGRETYISWKKNIQSFPRVFNADIELLFDHSHDFNDMFLCNNRTHPLLFTHFIQKDVSVETLIVLNNILNFVPDWNKNIDDPIVWPSYANKIKKYTPFLKFDTSKYMQILKKQIL